MGGIKVGLRRIGALAALVALAAAACDRDRDPADPGDGPDPGPGDGPYLALSILLEPEADFLNDAPPDWSPDGRRVVFAARPASSIWRMSTSLIDLPVLVTDPESTIWSDGAYTPGFLGDGRIFYYQGWTGLERSMRVMAADTNQVESEPRPAVLRRFSGPDVGLAENQASSPQELYLSADGTHAVGRWRSIYTLTWDERRDEQQPVSRRPEALAGATALDLSRDGRRIVFADQEGRIAWMDFYGETATTIGEGAYPSWRGDGEAVGYVAADGRRYCVHDLATGATTAYWTAGVELRHARLSWSGDRIVYLDGEGDFTRLGLGVLVPGAQGRSSAADRRGSINR